MFDSSSIDSYVYVMEIMFLSKPRQLFFYVWLMWMEPSKTEFYGEFFYGEFWNYLNNIILFTRSTNQFRNYKFPRLFWPIPIRTSFKAFLGSFEFQLDILNVPDTFQSSFLKLCKKQIPISTKFEFHFDKLSSQYCFD